MSENPAEVDGVVADIGADAFEIGVVVDAVMSNSCCTALDEMADLAGCSRAGSGASQWTFMRYGCAPARISKST